MAKSDIEWFNEGMRIRAMTFRSLAGYWSGSGPVLCNDDILPRVLGKDCWDYPKDRYSPMDWGCFGPDCTPVDDASWRGQCYVSGGEIAKRC